MINGAVQLASIILDQAKFTDLIPPRFDVILCALFLQVCFRHVQKLADLRDRVKFLELLAVDVFNVSLAFRSCVLCEPNFATCPSAKEVFIFGTDDQILFIADIPFR